MRSYNAMIGESFLCINTMSLFSMFVVILLVSSVLCDSFTEPMILPEYKECMSDTFNLLSSWKVRHNENCTLIGVSCNSNHSVRVLCLSGNYSLSPDCSNSFESPLHLFGIRINCSGVDENLVGNMQPVIGELTELGRLKRLEILDIFGNALKGPTPAELGKCANLLIYNLSSLFSRTQTVHDLCDHFRQASASFGPAPFAFVLVAQKIINGSQDSLPPPRFKVNNESTLIVAAIALLSVLLLVVVFMCRRNKGSNSSIPIPEPPQRREVTVVNDIGAPLTFENVIEATGNFSSTKCIGIGGFSAVYRAEVSSGTVVAVKRLSPTRHEEGQAQFLTEISILRRLCHRFIVTLIGFHSSVDEMFLIYNYISGGNLENYIQEREVKRFCWIKIHKISLQIATAISWLHDHFTPQVLHRDIKPSNILLDDECNAYLSDFGLAMLLTGTDADAQAEVVGTFAYIAPEYASSSQVSDKIDVYSYGVLLLELMSEKKALDPSFEPYGNGFNIVSWARMQTENGNEMEVFAAVLRDDGPEEKLLEMLRLALRCTATSPSERPRMEEVVHTITALEDGGMHQLSSM